MAFVLEREDTNHGAVDVFVKPGDEEMFLRCDLPNLHETPVNLVFAVDVGLFHTQDVTEQLSIHRARKRQAQIHGPNETDNDEAGLGEQAPRLDWEYRQSFRLPKLLEAAAMHIGGVLKKFMIGDEYDGYPAFYITSAEWCAFFSQCACLEQVELRSCYTADDRVFNVLGNIRSISKLAITGNDKISGSLSARSISRLCRERAGCIIVAHGRVVCQRKGPGAPGWATGFFQSLIELDVLDQDAIGKLEMDEVVAACPGLCFLCGKSDSFSLAAKMIGKSRGDFYDSADVVVGTSGVVRADDQNADEDALLDGLAMDSDFE